MLHKVIAIYDNKAEAYNTPVFVQSHGAAIRSFSDTVNDENSEFHKHPNDYSMVALGEYNDADGVFSTQSPVQIASAKDLLQS